MTRLTAEPAAAERAFDRRRLLFTTAAGLVAAGAGVGKARAATDDDLAYANFGLAASFLLADYYGRALEVGRLGPAVRPTLQRGQSASNRQARALAELLTGAGDTPAAAEDFTFEWPAAALATGAATRRTGLAVLRPVLGAYQTAAATLSETSYRVLFASLAASVGQQVGALALEGTGIEPFPVALNLEAASAALDTYLG